jgi:hypothetical protein
MSRKEKKKQLRQHLSRVIYGSATVGITSFQRNTPRLPEYEAMVLENLTDEQCKEVFDHAWIRRDEVDPYIWSYLAANRNRRVQLSYSLKKKYKRPDYTVNIIAIGEAY